MVDQPDLNGINQAASDDPTAAHVQVQKIKNDSSVVDGVHIGEMDKIPLHSRSNSKNVETQVDKALAFKPSGPPRPTTVLSAAAQMRLDFLGFNLYVSARNKQATQIKNLLESTGNVADDATVSALVMERTINARAVEASAQRTEQTGILKDLLRFQTSAHSAYMKQSLALQYRQLFALKDLITLTKATADLTDTKLEAIKINTRLPEGRKVKFTTRIRLAAIKEIETHLVKAGIAKGLPFVGGTLSDILTSNSTTDLAKGAYGKVGDVGNLIRKTSVGNTALDIVKPATDLVNAIITGTASTINNMIPGFIHPDTVWKGVKTPREFAAKTIRDFTNVPKAGGHGAAPAAGGGFGSPQVLAHLASMDDTLADIRACMDCGGNRRMPPGRVSRRPTRRKGFVAPHTTHSPAPGTTGHTPGQALALNATQAYRKGGKKKSILAGLPLPPKVKEYLEKLQASGYVIPESILSKFKIPKGLKDKFKKSNQSAVWNMPHEIENMLAVYDPNDADQDNSKLDDFIDMLKDIPAGIKQNYTRAKQAFTKEGLGRARKSAEDAFHNARSTLGDVKVVGVVLPKPVQDMLNTLADLGFEIPESLMDKFHVPEVIRALLRKKSKHLQIPTDIIDQIDALALDSDIPNDLMSRIKRLRYHTARRYKTARDAVRGGKLGTMFDNLMSDTSGKVDMPEFIKSRFSNHADGNEGAPSARAAGRRDFLGRKRKYVFADIYRKGKIKLGDPLVSKEQLENGAVARIDGKKIKSLQDLDVPILDAETGDVLISRYDIKKGLVTSNGQSIFYVEPRTFVSTVGDIGLTTLGIYGTVLKGFAGTLKFGTGMFFKKRQRSPYCDVYVKGQVEAGKPLLTVKQLKQGLVFGDGTRVHDVAQITRPILDPRTGETVVTEEDLQTGLVDVFGKKISSRKSNLSIFGASIDVTKYALKTTGKIAKPLMGGYVEMLKFLPKAMLGIGGLISKSIVGVLSSGAPAIFTKGLMGIAGTFTKMYASIFTHGVAGAGKLGFGILKRLFGFGGGRGGKGDVSKKDIYNLVSVRLDHIYTLLDSRLANDNVRANGYADHENRLKKDRENLEHVREDEAGDPANKTGLFGRLAALFGGGAAAEEAEDKKDKDKDPAKDGVVDEIEKGGEQALGSAIIGKYAHRIPGARYVIGASKWGARKLLKIPGMRFIPGLAAHAVSPLAKHAASAEATVAAAVAGASPAVEEAILKTKGSRLGGIASGFGKIAEKTGLKEVFKLGGKMGGKSLLKKIPGLALIAGAGFAADRARHGDYSGAALELASGALATFLPGWGTAGSVAIDAYLAYRDLHKSTGSVEKKLLAERWKAYGTTSDQAKLISDLEARSLQLVVSGGKQLITKAEQRDWATRFGFDPKNTGQYEYFSSWLDQRFHNGYLLYIASLKKCGYKITTTDAELNNVDAGRILKIYTKYIEQTAGSYYMLIPTLAGYKKLHPSDQDTAAASSPQAPSPKDFGQAQSQNAQPGSIKPADLPLVTPAAYTPNNSPINPGSFTQAGYTPPGAVGGPQYRQAAYMVPGAPANQNASYTPASLTYAPNAANANTAGYTPFNGATLPNTSTPGPTSTQLAAARAAYAKTAAGSTSALPTGHAYWNSMYNLLLAAAKAQGIKNPEVIAQLGATQSSLETGYGRSVANNNYFGIKAKAGTGASVSTHEFINGKMVATQGNFRTYGGPSDSAFDYITFLRQNSLYKGVLAASTLSDAINAQAHTGYATDPAYGSKLASIASSNVKNMGPMSAAQYAALSTGTPGQPGASPSQVASIMPPSPSNVVPPGGYSPTAPASGPSTQVASAYPGGSIPQAPAAPSGGYSPVAPANTNTPASGSGTSPPPGFGFPRIMPPPGGYSPLPSRAPIGMPFYPQQASYQMPNGAYPQPSGRIMNPIRTALQAVEDVRNATAALANGGVDNGRSPYPPIQVMPHPELLAATRDHTAVARQQLDAMGLMNGTLGGLFRLHQSAHGPGGVFSQMSDNIANQKPPMAPVLAPTINHIEAPHCETHNGFNVKKKREPRYAM